MMARPTVEPEETLDRQIGPGGDPIWFDPDRQPPVYHAAFLPSAQDHDGLSLIRSRFRTEIWAAYRPEQPEQRFRLARLPVRQLVERARQAGFPDLHFNPSPDQLDREHGEPWAHCVASQINRVDYDGDKETKMRIKQWARNVAETLPIGGIEGPFDRPSGADPYRPWS